MSAPHIPAAPPRARLALTGIALACGLVVYVIAVPLTLRSGAVGWQLAVVIALAVIASVGVLAALWQLRGDLAASRTELGRQAAQTAQVTQESHRQSDEINRLCQEISRQADKISRQSEEISGQETRVGELTAEAERHRDRENHLLGERGKLRDDLKDVQRQAEDVRQLSAAMEHAVRHTVTERIPNALMGQPIPPAQDKGVDEEVAKLLSETVDCATDAGEQSDSMRAAVVAMSRRVQAAAHRIQEEAGLMADRHPGNADVLEVSMRVDHAAAQQARTAQSMAVLLGEWPGQQWPDPLPLVDVVRAASGRIIAYRRVEVAGDPDIAASETIVEPLIHLVAELLANATQSSPPTTQVPVTVRAVQRGAVIEVHDCGVGLDDYRLSEARAVATGKREIGLQGLGEFPQTGLAVVGQYVVRHGFRVDISESVYGGVRAIVGVPAELTETVEPAEITPVPAARVPQESAASATSGSATAEPAAAQTAAAQTAAAQPTRTQAATAQVATSEPAAVQAAAAEPATTQAATSEPAGAAPEPAEPALTRRSGLPRRVSPRHDSAPADAGYGSAGTGYGTPGSGYGSGYSSGYGSGAGGPAEEQEQPTPEEAGAWMGAFLTTSKPDDEPSTASYGDSTFEDDSTRQQEQG